MADEGRVPDDAVLRIREPEQRDGINWRDIQAINVRLGTIEHRLKTIEDGAAGKNDRAFHTKTIIISVLLTAFASIGAPMAVDRLLPEQPEAAAAAEAP